jgi:NADP-dependent 3-hydroxy acid dehydrogenase YdfG
MAETSGRNAVVTGAAGGMGRAITRALLESGRRADAFKSVDILINNAGHDIGGRTRFDSGPADDWSSIILTRYRGDRKKEKDYFDQFRMALDPEDIARSIVFALDQPPHVQIAKMMILPVNRY